MEVLAKLGIDWKLLLAQVVNFAILFFVLRRYAYRPMLDFLEKRAARIEQGLRDADAAKKKLGDMTAQEKEVLAQAHTEARAIVAAAETAAKKRDAERTAETEAKVKRLLDEATAKIAEEQEKALASAKQEISNLVLLSVEKILREKIDSATEKKILEKMTV